MLRSIIRFFFISDIFLSLFTGNTGAQERLGPNIYLIRFTDKNQNTYDLSKPEQFLSERAILRRTRQGIEYNINDLPVSRVYIDSLKKMGFEVLNYSKWLNAVCVKTTDISLLNKLGSLSFVKYSLQKSVFKSARVSVDKFEQESSLLVKDTNQFYGPSFDQIAIHHGNFLHSHGFRGQGILIAVLDAGFSNAQNMSGFNSLWMENRVLLTRDFVNAGGNVFTQNSHGSNVLSVMACTTPGYLVGTAPKASFLLFRTEDAASEYPVEEFNWIAGAELADSMGADIINSSLGYTTFNDVSLNHTYADMNGRTAISTIGANVASSKGIVVVVSAGNEGGSFWKYIGAPADANDILAVGAVNANGLPAFFSSRGPSYDRRIKPDIVAVGDGTVIQNTDNVFGRSNGTSFSAPVISGLVACLWQACPGKNNKDIIRAIQQFSSQYTMPDSIIGYGIPDFKNAFYDLNPSLQPSPGYLSIYPNPFSDWVNIEFGAIPEGQAKISIYDIAGRQVFSESKRVYKTVPNNIVINKLGSLPRGVYVVEVSSKNQALKTKILKF